MSDILIDRPELASLGQYEFGWADSDAAGASARRGLSPEVVKDISALKNEPGWMLQRRLKALQLFERKPMPTWGADLSEIDFDPAAGAANTPEALHGLVLTYVILPVAMVAVGGLVMIGYRLDEHRHAEIRSRLEARDAASRQEAPEVETTVAVPPLIALEPGASA